MAHSARDKALGTEATELGKAIASIAMKFKDVRMAERKLSTEPDNPKANLIFGRFLCFFKGDWKHGLPCLAIGTNPKLRAIAVKELTNPEGAEAQAGIGEAWVELSKGEDNSETRQRYQERARVWLEKDKAIQSVYEFVRHKGVGFAPLVVGKEYIAFQLIPEVGGSDPEYHGVIDVASMHVISLWEEGA